MESAIGPPNSDFFIYGGITRDVWLRKVPATYISNIKITPNNVPATPITEPVMKNIFVIIEHQQVRTTAKFSKELFNHSLKKVSS